MLVLSRKATETIVINNSVRITVLRVKGDRVRLGIEAPPEVAVDRAEVHARRTEFVVDIPFEAAAAVCDETVDLGGVLVATADDTAN